MKVIGIESSGAGTNNQIRGVILEAAKEENSVPVTRNDLLKAADGTLLHHSKFNSEKDYLAAIDAAVSAYCLELRKNGAKAPEFVVLPYDHSNGPVEYEGIDILSRGLKQSFAEHGVKIKTMVIASNLYNYQDVDLIHVGKHQLSAADEQTLRETPSLKSRIIETLGVPSNLSWLRIKQEAGSPLKKAELAKFRGRKTVLFSLGGKTENGAITFTLDDAKKLFDAALKLKCAGYKVAFTNSPRTPDDVTDFLYEKCKLLNMDFYNSKQLARTFEEAERNFRLYDGKYKNEFAAQAERTGGNIYPAILSVCSFVVNTHDSFSYTSDAAALGITSVVYTGNKIDSERRPDCHKLFSLCHESGYVVSLDEALTKITKKEKLATKPMSGVSSQIIQGMQHANTDLYLTISKSHREH